MDSTQTVQAPRLSQFQDRIDAGQRLATVLSEYRENRPIVMALVRGGIVVGAEIARLLHLPLGVVLVRKIGHPSYPEFAVGAVVEGERPIYQQGHNTNIQSTRLSADLASARRLIAKRHKLYYSEHVQPQDVHGRTVILVDDGIATGLSALAAVKALRHQHAQRIIVAVPVASRDGMEMLAGVADEVVVLVDPEEFRGSVSMHYQEFDPVSDMQVVNILEGVNHEKIY